MTNTFIIMIRPPYLLLPCHSSFFLGIFLKKEFALEWQEELVIQG